MTGPADSPAGRAFAGKDAEEVAAARRWLESGAGARSLVALVRHGEVENPEGLRYGRLPGFPLSARGRAQAAAAAAVLAPLAPVVRAIVASPLTRTRETAAVLAEWLPAPVGVDDRLLEAVSRFDGMARRRIAHPLHLPALWNPLVPSWAESFREVGERTRVAILAAERDARGGAVVVVGHQSPLWLGLLALEHARPGPVAALLRNLPPWLRRPGRPAPGSVTLLRFEAGRLAAPPWRATPWMGCIGR